MDKVISVTVDVGTGKEIWLAEEDDINGGLVGEGNVLYITKDGVVKYAYNPMAWRTFAVKFE